MPRDYAKKNQSKPRRKNNASRHKNTGFPTTALVVVGLFVAGFIGFLGYLKLATPDNSTLQKTVTDKSVSPNKDQPVQTAKKDPPKQPEVPTYTFHDILDGKEVFIPEEDLKRPENAVSMQFVMPCGSFRNHDIAEALRAKIAFMGFESKVLTIDANSGRWYRIELGPYASKRQAESIRHRLQENDINDCKIWGQKL